jgi:putative nucleotidyltransferase with HDIG domain
MPKMDRAFFLPPSFQLIPRLLGLLDNPQVDSEEVAAIIRVDPALTTDVLRVSNGVHFSGGSRVATVNEAVLRIGLREIYRIVARMLASPVFQASQRTPAARLDLWKHSLAAAMAAHLLARRSGDDPEVAFTTALLHDVGKLVLSQAHGLRYVALVEESSLEKRGISHLEQAAFHVDHATVGGRILQQWNFPEKISAAVVSHHNPLRASRSNGRLSAITYLANILAYRIGRGLGFPDYVLSPDPNVLEVLDCPQEDFDDLQQEVSEEFDRAEQRFR